jgi:membrane-bound lytic murein transglycosylase D
MKMNLNIIKRISLIGLVVFASVFFIYAVVVDSKTESIKNFPMEINFAGEKTPTNIVDVYERLDREIITNTNYHTNSILVLKRANKVFPIIEPILAKYGVPDDFKYLAVIESSLVNAVSPAGARGVWQFMPETAKEKGLEVTDEVDERYHLVKSTQAACLYLKDAKEKFGSWTLAAASYNGGVNGVQRQLEAQGVTSYYDVLLNEETARYVFRILALKEIMTHPEAYGFKLPKAALYTNVPTRTIEIDSSISDFATFAKEQGINYKILKIHNPWLRDKKLINKEKRKYRIEIPTSGYGE